MNAIYIFFLKGLRKINSKFLYAEMPSSSKCINDPDEASHIIYEALMGKKPCMIARFGSTELATLVNYIGVTQKKRSAIRYIKGESMPWWWEMKMIHQMQNWSGFFPPTVEKIEQFCELMLKDTQEVDLLGSWLTNEKYLINNLSNANKIHLRLLEPFWSDMSWTKALQGKKVLVVHPFAETIELQYKRRELLFENKDILPEFELKTIKAVQSIAGEETEFVDWFEALDFMKSEIDKCDYDVCLIAAGAYGFPLAAHVKRMGKKSVHLGGSLQLLFGIRGKRWEDPEYGVREWGIPRNSYTKLMNEFWIRPGENAIPKGANMVEGACYW